MSELLVVPAVGTSPTLAISDEAKETKKRLLISAYTTPPTLANESERDRAIKVAGDIQTHLKAVEKSRVEVKEPFLEMSREIDRTAREHVATLTSEKNRINGIIGEFEEGRQKASRIAVDESQPLDARLEAEETAGEAHKPKGGALRKDWDIEVTDIGALYLAHRQCVILTPNTMAIKDLLKVGITPPGVKATPKVAFAVRASGTALRDRKPFAS